MGRDIGRRGEGMGREWEGEGDEVEGEGRRVKGEGSLRFAPSTSISWLCHCCAYVSSRANVLHMISKTMVYRSLDTLKRLYKNLVRPHLLCVCLIIALCEGSRKAGKGAA